MHNVDATVSVYADYDLVGLGATLSPRGHVRRKVWQACPEVVSRVLDAIYFDIW